MSAVKLSQLERFVSGVEESGWSMEDLVLTNVDAMSSELRSFREHNYVIPPGCWEGTGRHAEQKAHLLKTVGETKHSPFVVDVLLALESPFVVDVLLALESLDNQPSVCSAWRK
jgi:hypothetical protein